MSWQKPARIVVAIVGLVVGRRRVFRDGRAASGPALRADSAQGCEGDSRDHPAVIRTNFPGIAKDFEVKCDLMSVYDDGTTKLTGNPLDDHRAQGRESHVHGHRLGSKESARTRISSS